MADITKQLYETDAILRSITQSHMPMKQAANILEQKTDIGVLLISGNESWNEATKTAIHACNAYDDLVAALKHSRSHLETLNFNSEGEFQHVIDEIDAALAKAKAVQS